MKKLAAFASVFLCAALACAQMGMPGDKQDNRPVRLVSALGGSHHAIKTASPRVAEVLRSGHGLHLRL